MTIDTYDIPPTILTTRIFPGIIPSTSTNHVSWNSDGQCLFITKKGVNIVTPHLTTTLPPPTILSDSSVALENPSAVIGNESERRAAFINDQDEGSDEDGLDNFEDNPTAPTNSTGLKKGITKVRRPKLGEIKLWNTGIELDKEGKRGDVYGWNDIGDEITAVYTEKEITTRQAVWSPSGLSDLGGSLLVVLSSAMQVSVYAPRNDPYTKQWDEIADLTAIMRSSVPPESLVDGLTVEAMLRLRTMTIQWSSHLPLTSMIGMDGSILALSNRAGGITFWSHGSDKRFHQVHSIDICEQGGWVSDMVWSEWKVLDENTCEAHLALSLTNGSIRIITVQRKVQTDTSGLRSWALDVQPPAILDRGDKRNITSIKWVDDILIWTKSGTVHIFAIEGNKTVKWNGIVTLRLERVGNWASANGLGPCIGINRINRDTLQIVLSSLTSHLIYNFTTSPTLAHPHESLRSSLALRDMFEDQLFTDPLIKIRFRAAEIQPEGWTAHTSGWTGLGWGGIGSWVSEPLSFHTLDNATEGKRSMTFVLANTGKAGPIPDQSVIEDLREVLINPPNLLYTSSGRVLMPYLLHIQSMREPEILANDLAQLLSSLFNTAQTQHESPAGPAGLIQGFWNQTNLDKLRLGLVLASWCQRTFGSSAVRFQQIVYSLSTSITASILEILMKWMIDSPQLPAGRGLNRQFIDQIIKAARQIPSESMTTTLANLIASVFEKLDQNASGNQQDAEQRCPACKNEVGPDGICTRGHAWSRCSITHLLITHPHYRVCSTCPAISLLPRKYLSSPIPVDDEGKEHDHERFATLQNKGEDRMIQTVLEAAICCLNCGGRWQRAV